MLISVQSASSEAVIFGLLAEPLDHLPIISLEGPHTSFGTRVFLDAATSHLVSGLILPQTTNRPNRRINTSSTPEPGVSTTTKSDDSGVATYKFVNPRTDITCILLQTDAVVEVKFKLNGLPEQADSYIPAKPLIDGDCRNEDESNIRISWTGYSLEITFSKTPGGERWFISNVELSVSPDLPKLHGVAVQRGSIIKFYHRHMLIPTPVGKSFSCDEVMIPLETDEDDHPPPDIHAELFLRLLQVQPFMYKGDNFQEAVGCKSQKSFRGETAPLVVGSTLAVAVLATITGYGIYRYAKVKNVQYNTME